jgi:hypothetical protein
MGLWYLFVSGEDEGMAKKLSRIWTVLKNKTSSLRKECDGEVCCLSLVENKQRDSIFLHEGALQLNIQALHLHTPRAKSVEVG